MKKTASKSTKSLPIKNSEDESLQKHNILFPPYPIDSSEAFMNESQRMHFKNILLTWQEKIQQKIADLNQHLQDENLRLSDPSDVASQEEEVNKDAGMEEHYYQLIKQVDGALQKIEDRAYGFCESCGKGIDIRRLEAQPIAKLCIDCQQIAEIKLKS